MKLNFWQWLGVVLLVLGIAYYIYGHYLKPAPGAGPSGPTTRTSQIILHTAPAA